MPGTLLHDYIELDDLANEAGVTRRTVQRWVSVERPGLPITRLGRRPLVARSDLNEWLAARRTQRNLSPTKRAGR